MFHAINKQELRILQLWLNQTEAKWTATTISVYVIRTYRFYSYSSEAIKQWNETKIVWGVENRIVSTSLTGLHCIILKIASLKKMFVFPRLYCLFAFDHVY